MTPWVSLWLLRPGWGPAVRLIRLWAALPPPVLVVAPVVVMVAALTMGAALWMRHRGRRTSPRAPHS
jgi:hypothetical protein